MSRVLICNAFPDENRGGAAITSGTIEFVRRALPDTEISIMAVDRPSREQFRHTLRTHPGVRVEAPIVETPTGALAGLRTILRSLAVLLRARRGHPTPSQRDVIMVVSKGGHVFVQRKGMRGLMSLWQSALPLMTAARSGIPTVVSGATVGPFTTWGSRWLNGRILKRVSVIMTREEGSAEHAASLGVSRERILVVPDTAFVLPSPTKADSAEAARNHGLEGVRFAAITTRYLSGDRELPRRMAEVGRGLLDRGLVDRLVVIVQANDRYGSDLVASTELVRILGEDRAQLVADDLSPAELMALYGAASFTVAGRMHSAIFSLLAGTPAFPLGLVRGKSTRVFQSFGLERFVLPQNLSPPGMVDIIDREMKISAQARAEIANVVHGARKDLEQVPQILRSAAEQDRRAASAPTNELRRSAAQ